ncbi:MAG: WbqC family protein [Bacteroidia bacterium]|jgi:hypothetical protein
MNEHYQTVNGSNSSPLGRLGGAAILSTAYLGPIQHYSKLFLYPECTIEHYEHFTKQTYRSRCDVYSPNGLITLSVPLVKRAKRQAVKDLKISYDYDWQLLHWRTLESGYRRSPFFEYYEDDFYPFYSDKKYDFLIDLNEDLQQVVLELLKKRPNYDFSTEYHKSYPEADDYREIISPKVPLETDTLYQIRPYSQVFDTRHGFIPNLSIVDLLFNQGPRATEFI